jgi:two-component system, NtrC family, sensor histidine kinase PilS
MSLQPQARIWFDRSASESDREGTDELGEFERLWRGFMTARVMLGLVLLLLQGVIYELGSSNNLTLTVLCAGYCVVALAVRLRRGERPLRTTLDAQWMTISGVDIVFIAALQIVQGNSINYAPLFALPILMTSVLGSLLLSMAGAAGVTLMLLAYAAWMSVQAPTDAATYFLQAALSGAGSFVIAFLVSQIVTRLTNVELTAQRNQTAVRMQRKVNELVIETLADGILVLDQGCTVRAANPAARRMLGAESAMGVGSFDLRSMAAWQDLVDLMQLSFSENSSRQADVSVHHAGQGPTRLRVRSQLTAAPGASGQSLCVMFLQDQREMEARMRTEKLASMGRLSAAVAHEIRNPLAAIAQANALLDEDLSDPRHKQLTRMVRQNAKRLEKIAEEVLDVTRVQRRDNAIFANVLELNTTVTRICCDWQDQTNSEELLRFDLCASEVKVRFEAEHLHRILVNLLDNARRYSGNRPGSIEVGVSALASRRAELRVWSDGEHLDQSVERHLFEPFFSSESRSSGLGLYICRELCEEQGGSIAYFRTSRKFNGKVTEGNEFLVTFQTPESDQTFNGKPAVKL